MHYIKFHNKTLKITPTYFDPKITLRELRCSDDVRGDIGGCSARRALKPKFYQPTQTVVTAGTLPFRENSHGRAGNRTRDLMISSQIL